MGEHEPNEALENVLTRVGSPRCRGSCLPALVDFLLFKGLHRAPDMDFAFDGNRTTSARAMAWGAP